MKPKEKQNVYSIAVIEQAFDVLEILATGEDASVSMTLLSDRLALSRNKMFRVLKTLEDRGLVEKDPVTWGYRLGVSAMELAHRIVAGSSLLNHAHPVMEDLVHKHGEAVYMSVLDGDDIVFVDMVDCDQQIRAASFVGRRFPFFTNAAGKVLKALVSEDRIEKVLRTRAQEVPHPDALVDELSTIRHRGIAVDVGGLGEGIMTVAVAVRDYAGRSVGALTVLAPSFRLLADRLESEIIPSLMDSAMVLSAKFGYARG